MSQKVVKVYKMICDILADKEYLLLDESSIKCF